jgi:hypothetical protein
MQRYVFCFKRQIFPLELYIPGHPKLILGLPKLILGHPKLSLGLPKLCLGLSYPEKS